MSSFDRPTLPVIDIAPFVRAEVHNDAARASTAAAWDNAMRTHGFALVSGHGVPSELVGELRSSALRFFSHEKQRKMQFCHGPYGSKGGGYTPQGVESVGRTLGGDAPPPDLVENYVMRGRPAQWGIELPAHAPELASCGKRYFCALEEVLHALNRLSARALGLDQGYFDRFFDPPSCSLRLAHYPPLPEEVEEGQLRYGAHTDYQGFTILLQDERDEGVVGAGGLEVMLKGQWTPVTPKRGCFVVNIGDLWQTWTNGRWCSTLHRVANPPRSSEAATRDRLSIPYFTGPKNDAMIEPIPTCVDELHPAKYAPVSARDHLLAKLGKSNV